MKKRIFNIAICSILLLGSLFTWFNVYASEPILWNEMEISSFRENKGGKEYYTHPTQAGYVFAGWFQSKGGKSISEDRVSGKAYAKFVKEDVLSVKGQLCDETDVESDTTYLRMVTSADSLQYNRVGFKVKILDRTSYRWSTTAYATLSGYVNDKQESYTPSVFSEISQYFVAYRISNIPNVNFLTGLTITPIGKD